jgi:hypothetical protein
MPDFAYIARDAAGQKITGTLSANTIGRCSHLAPSISSAGDGGECRALVVLQVKGLLMALRQRALKERRAALAVLAVLKDQS